MRIEEYQYIVHSIAGSKVELFKEKLVVDCIRKDMTHYNSNLSSFVWPVRHGDSKGYIVFSKNLGQREDFTFLCNFIPSVSAEKNMQNIIKTLNHAQYG